MNPNEAAWLLFLGPVLFLAAGGLVYWITGRQDRAGRRGAKAAGRQG